MKYRVVWGGSFDCVIWGRRAAFCVIRVRDAPEAGDGRRGFRVVVVKRRKR